MIGGQFLVYEARCAVIGDIIIIVIVSDCYHFSVEWNTKYLFLLSNDD